MPGPIASTEFLRLVSGPRAVLDGDGFKNVQVPKNLLAHYSTHFRDLLSEIGDKNAVRCENLSHTTLAKYIQTMYTGGFEYDEEESKEPTARMESLIMLLVAGRVFKSGQLVGDACAPKLEEIIRKNHGAVDLDLIQRVFDGETRDQCMESLIKYLMKEWVAFKIKQARKQKAAFRFSDEMRTNKLLAEGLMEMGTNIMAQDNSTSVSSSYPDPFNPGSRFLV